MEGMEPVAVAPKEDNEEDFFTSWSKPNTPKTSQPGTPRVSTPPVIGRPQSAASGTVTNASSPPTPAATPATTAAPRTITSSAASRPGRLGAGNSRLNSASSTVSAGSTVKKSKLGLGASKAKPVDFAEAERKAREEEERIKKLGYDREREQAEEKAKKEADALKLSSAVKTQLTISSTPTTTTSTSRSAPTPDPKKAAAFPRLGFGAIPGAGAAAAVSASSASSSKQNTPVVDDAPTTAREKFGTQKAISSDMFFGRGNYDADNAREAQTRLQSFQGATAISSNQYFGREEDEGQRDDLEGGLLGDGNLSGIENAARDAISRVLANPDVQNAADNIRAGALKVRSAIRFHIALLILLSSSSPNICHPCLNVKDITFDLALSPFLHYFHFSVSLWIIHLFSPGFSKSLLPRSTSGLSDL